ncbi:hypothetical protein Q4Q35_12285 [Flavivirga aquimarina]|uniref:Uncharacterized protein n=1 Tax=Flavivirga aquimarina TaxID=2027862 RepID=A0ABT8WC33_9FLAO|nr:hypothetical protein [Flavivirga aquimarina]MDO5970586.1 hypothetical protein [Flavivirga aquimarina]
MNRKYKLRHITPCPIIALVSAYLENSFGILSDSYLFTKLVTKPRNEIKHVGNKNQMRNFLFLIILCLQSCHEQSEYSKDDALVQSLHCLEIKQELGAISNLRNPYFKQLVKILESDSIPKKNVSDIIMILSIEINRSIENSKRIIDSLKPKHKDTRFFDATYEYLILNENLEAKTKILFNSLINPNSDKNKEKELGQEVETLALQVLTEQTKYKKKESIFHNDNNIVQREVDSIVSIIKSK